MKGGILARQKSLGTTLSQRKYQQWSLKSSEDTPEYCYRPILMEMILCKYPDTIIKHI
ncbi:hypothetical protein LBYZC6_50960 [Lacrimispora brassicae]